MFQLKARLRILFRSINLSIRFIHLLVDPFVSYTKLNRRKIIIIIKKLIIKEEEKEKKMRKKTRRRRKKDN